MFYVLQQFQLNLWVGLVLKVIIAMVVMGSVLIFGAPPT